MTAFPPEVRAEGLGVRVRAKTLLEGVDLTLPPRSMTVLLGPNGAGKTTLLRALAGVLSPSSGSVRLDGISIRQIRRRQVARRLAYVPQSSDARFSVRVEDVVIQGRYPHVGALGRYTPADRDRVDWAIERIGLGPLRRRTLPTLSGGELRRVFLARALAQEAPVIVLDEPIAGLDVARQIEFLDLLTALNRDGRTILATLHDFRPALDHFPRAVVLHGGRVVADGPTAEVIAGPTLGLAFGVRLRPGDGLRLDLVDRPD